MAALLHLNHLLKRILLLLSDKAGIKDSKTFKGHKAVFMSLHGGGKQVDPISRQRVKIGIVLCYVVPIRQRGKILHMFYYYCGYYH